MRKRAGWLVAVAALAGIAATGGLPTSSQALAGVDAPIFTDALAGGWSNWSWSTTANFAAATPVHSGVASLAVTYTGAWGGLYLHVAPALSGATYRALHFWIHGGGAGGQQLRVLLADGNGDFGPSSAITAPSGHWAEIDIALTSLGSPASITGVSWQDTSGGAQPAFYLDDVRLVAWDVPPTPTPAPTPAAGPAIAVDAAAGVHPISPDIYGMNYADEALAAELRLPVRRWGGNSTSRYNWQADETNTGSDWYFENVPTDSGAADAFVDQDRRTGTKTLMTVPLIGRVAKRRLDSHPYDCGFKVSKYGAQQATDPWDADCGNGIRPNSSEVTGNDPNDTSIVITPAFVQDWVQHLVAKYGPASAGGVAYYNLDNEPMLWPGTHRDVHPEPTSYDEMRDRTWAYGAAVKAGDPSARTLGPAEWGWTGYFWSALDWVGGDWWNHPADRLAHGNVPFVEWYLQQMAAYEQQHGVRVLDYLDEHFYPPGVALAGAGGADLQALDAVAVGRDVRRGELDRRAGVHDPAHARLDRGRLPRHPHRGHRVQLGRARPHQRRPRPGRRARHLRPRGARPGDAVGAAVKRRAGGVRVPHVPQRRRRRVGVRRDLGARRQQRPGAALGVCRPPRRGRRPDGRRDQQDRRRPDQRREPGRIRARGQRPGAAVLRRRPRRDRARGGPATAERIAGHDVSGGLDHAAGDPRRQRAVADADACTPARPPRAPRRPRVGSSATWGGRVLSGGSEAQAGDHGVLMALGPGSGAELVLLRW